MENPWHVPFRMGNVECDAVGMSTVNLEVHPLLKLHALPVYFDFALEFYRARCL